jgi:hypothetical protein
MLSALLLVSFEASASECPVNFVSAKYSDAKNEIVFWHAENKILGDKQIAYETENHISSLLSSVDSSTRPVIVWVENAKRDNRLMSITKQPSGKWSRPLIIASSKNELSSPSLMRAPDGSSFVAWASDESGDDDIYFARYSDAKWSSAKVAHGENRVPDILPTLSVSNDGSIALSWRTFVNPNIGYEDKLMNLSSALSAIEMKQLLAQQCKYDRPSIKHPDSDEPLFINYYQDAFFSTDKSIY